METVKLGQEVLVTPEMLKEMIESEAPFYLLDIRKEEDFEEGSIPSAVHSEWEAVADLIQEGKLPKDKKIIIYCYNGQSSMQVAMVLNMQGYDAYSLLDGYKGWRQLID